MEDMIMDRLHEAIDDLEDELGHDIDFTIMTKKTARLIVQWALAHGHTKEEAYDLLATTLGAAVP